MDGLLTRLLAHARTPLFRNAYAMMVNHGVNALFGVAFWVVAARLFAPADVGVNAALLSTMSLAALLSQLGMRPAMAWLLPSAGSAAGTIIRRSYLVSAALTCVVAPAALLLFVSVARASTAVTADPMLILWFTAAALLSSVFALQDGVLVGLRVATWVPVENALFGAIKLVALPLLVATGLGIFAAWTLALPPLVMGVNLLIFGRLLPRAPKREPDARLKKTRAVLTFISGDFVGNLLIQGVIRLIPALVVAMLGAVANAYSYQAWTVALPLFLTAGSMVSSLTVESLTVPERAVEYARRMLRNMIRVLVPLSLLLAATAPFVLEIFGPAYAREGTLLLRLLALATIPISLNVWFYALCRVRGTVTPILWTQAVVAVVAVGLSALLLPVVGITASGIAWLVGQSLAAVFVLAREFRWHAGTGLAWPQVEGLNAVEHGGRPAT